jgi:hypothetical protein
LSKGKRSPREANGNVHEMQLHMENGRRDEKDAVADIENAYMDGDLDCLHSKKNNYSQYYPMSTYKLPALQGCLYTVQMLRYNRH